MSRTKSAAPYLRALNAAQRRAAEHTLGPVLVLAGAGTGKTTMIVHRIVHLIRAERVEPASIVAVTVTNKAADEMRGRVRRHAGDVARQITISTFNALGARVLREHGERLGLPRRFAIYASGDQLGALRAACGEISIADDAFDLKRVLRRISEWKNRGIDPVAARRLVRDTRAAGTRADARVARAGAGGRGWLKADGRPCRSGRGRAVSPRPPSER
jgi:DNA helicase II / ATP-dependent DNA helicase PcrA